MNVQKQLSKIYNTVKYLQVPESEINAGNFGRGAYMAGMLDSAKLFMKTYNGELTETQIEIELAKLKSISETVN